jgi:hypothetical protein
MSLVRCQSPFRNEIDGVGDGLIDHERVSSFILCFKRSSVDPFRS